MSHPDNDSICEYNGQLISFASEGWLDAELQADAIRQQIAVSDIDQWVRQQLDMLFDHLKSCERCQAMKANIASEGSMFDDTRADPRVFGHPLPSDNQPPDEFVNRVA